MNKFQRLTSWQHWKRGMVAIACAFFVCVVPLSLGIEALKAMPQWPILKAICGTLLFVVWLIATPILLSLLKIVETDSREKLAAAIFGQLDQMAVQAGVNWEGHYLWDVDRLLQQHRFQDAKKLYHDAANVTWDEANGALDDWTGTLLVKKLEILRQHVPITTDGK